MRGLILDIVTGMFAVVIYAGDKIMDTGKDNATWFLVFPLPLYLLLFFLFFYLMLSYLLYCIINLSLISYDVRY